jgi:cell wall-associated NlpC family hydrolase
MEVYMNPLFFVSTGDFGMAYYGDAGAAMGDGSYAALIAEAERHLGKPYIFGASGPNAFDCSSYVCWVYTQSGVRNIPRTDAQGLYNMCVPIPLSEAQPGDMIFLTDTYSSSNVVTHVAIYVGNNMVIHAGSPVQYSSITNNYWQSHYFSAGRLTGGN